MEDDHLLPCPFCGSSMDVEDSDTIHPSGTFWKERSNGLRAYVGRNEEHDGSCYVVTCCTIYGGCDASITADSKEEVIQRWNTRSKV